MKKLSSALIIIILPAFFLSCGKEKKPEYTDDEKAPKSEFSKTNDESKTEVKTDDPVDSGKQNTAPKTDNFKNRNFENEKPEASVSPLEAKDYNGKTITVTGFVADVYQSDKVAYLNFVEKYPNNPFTAVIFSRTFGDFPDVIKYKGKNVEVTGRVSIYNRKPQIILNSPKQLVVK